MSNAPLSRSLFLRSYLFIVGGLVLVAVILDFSFRQLHSDTLTPQLAESAMQLVELRLSELPPDLNREQQTAELQAIQTELGYPIRLLPADHVVTSDRSSENLASDDLVEMSDGDNRVSFMRASKRLNVRIQIGPFDEPEHVLLRWLPPLFYLAVFTIIGIWLIPIMKDLNLISRAAGEFAADYRKPIRIAEEVATLDELATHLDDMSAQIHGLVRSQKELSGALSHEMRTPLARIKFALAVMHDKEENREDHVSILEDVEEIEKLIDTMLDYARLDHPGTQLLLEQTPIDEWLAASTEKMGSAECRIEIVNEQSAEHIRIDPQLMGLAVSNLLVNACRYARSRVTLRVFQHDSMTGIHVDDDGPGIPVAERETVFEPFTRLDDSRSKHTGGYGLGLAIVARIAVLHGGHVSANTNTDGGARLTIQWPGSI